MGGMGIGHEQFGPGDFVVSALLSGAGLDTPGLVGGAGLVDRHGHGHGPGADAAEQVTFLSIRTAVQDGQSAKDYRGGEGTGRQGTAYLLQQHAQVGFEINMTGDIYHAWMNPFPLLPNHVVIAEENHISQEWDIGGDGQERVTLSRLLGDLCEMAQRMPNHVGFYNGVDAGASIPSHLHFQFFRRPPADPVFPLERHRKQPPLTLSVLAGGERTTAPGRI